MSGLAANRLHAMNEHAQPLLKIPPFPGAKVHSFRNAGGSLPPASRVDPDELLSLMVSERVGGTYWGKQPRLPQHHRVIAVRDPSSRARLVRDIGAQNVFCCEVDETYDPWHLVNGAIEVIVDRDDDIAMVAAMAGVPVRSVGNGHFDGGNSKNSASDALRHRLGSRQFFDPFTGMSINARDAVRLCAFWRRLIDSNREIQAAFGIAAWKRPTVAPLLWKGAENLPFATGGEGVEGPVAVWRSRVSAPTLSALRTRAIEMIEVEDGFIRSAGLGADCIPPQSIIVDRRGVYFDPTAESDLEHILLRGQFEPELLERASQLRGIIVASGISKYEAAGAGRPLSKGNRKRILVPGQVEDDRAVLVGGQGLTSNHELLQRVRRGAPDAHIIYKPHPDVEAGHRKGHIPDEACLAVADEVVRDGAISHLIDVADEVHVNTSLAGFEALLRGKPVTTYGVPFYAGWGLTRDLGAVPERRSVRRTLDELVAAALILYPRYVDPKTGLPCPPEVLVSRLAEGVGGATASGPLVWLRRLQGRTKRQMVRFAK